MEFFKVFIFKYGVFVLFTMIMGVCNLQFSQDGIFGEGIIVFQLLKFFDCGCIFTILIGIHSIPRQFLGRITFLHAQKLIDPLLERATTAQHQ